MGTGKLFLPAVFILSVNLAVFPQDHGWKASRITSTQGQNESNTWIDFRREVELEMVPGIAVAKIACDSKYWLWINGELVVYEGQLKRGPTPSDTYFDQVDIAGFLKEGPNTIAILLWYFGKDGFSYNSSGEMGLAFQCDAIGLISDESWDARLDRGFEHAQGPYPNYRLPESHIRFNAMNGNFDWIRPGTPFRADMARVIGMAEDVPWNNLVPRMIPQWKNYGLREYENQDKIPSFSNGEVIVCELPYNCHISPYLEIESKTGQVITIQTDNYDYLGTDVASVRAEYVTREGLQEYESLGWMNGHVVRYFIPAGVRIRALKYRETGYDCDFTGYFGCNDPFYNKLWEKAVRTLYVTMRDTYMDCPERERAQWWGDVVNESGEAFYALSPSAAALTKKGILELINWQRSDGTLYSPVPEGNWKKELPGQMLASVGYYGFWNYYLNTGDIETLEKVYEGVKRYMEVWQINENGILIEREGDWYWGDWGMEIDKQLLYNAWYYLAHKGFAQMSRVLDREAELERTIGEMKIFKESFNRVFWDGKGYRTAGYEGKYDDRAQALAVVSGLAGPEKYPALLKIFRDTHLASPYMEKYVLEALFVMGEPETGLKRMKDRFYDMVVESPYTTLFENFGPGQIYDESGFVGYGTNNHAWSGGGLTLLSQYTCGLSPLKPAWKTFQVRPQLGSLTWAETGNETVSGRVAVKVRQDNESFDLEVEVPAGTSCIVCIPEKFGIVEMNGIPIFKMKAIYNEYVSFIGKDNGYRLFRVGPGTCNFKAR